jgi:hypothetical protein
LGAALHCREDGRGHSPFPPGTPHLPDDGDALYNLESALTKQGELEEYDHLLSARTPGSADAQDALVELAWLLGHRYEPETP